MIRPSQRKGPKQQRQQQQQRAGEATSSSSSAMNNTSSGNNCCHRQHHSVSPRSCLSDGGGVSATAIAAGEAASEPACCTKSGGNMAWLSVLQKQAQQQRRRKKKRLLTRQTSLSSSITPITKAWKTTFATTPASSKWIGFVLVLPTLMFICVGYTILLSAASTSNDDTNINQYQYLTRRRSSSTEPFHNNNENADPYSFQRYSTNAPSCTTPLDPNDITYTLVTQLSHDRLWMLEHHCKRWGREHKVSIAIYTNETVEDVSNILQNEYHCDTTSTSSNTPTMTVQTLPITYDKADYPVNELRNLAISAVQTTHIVYVDVDFWESTDLYGTLQEEAIKAKLSESYQNALVIPALALKQQCGEYIECPDKAIPMMPQTRTEAIPLILNRSVTAFDPTNFGGHGSTRYAEWLEQEPHELLPIECVHSNRYEPYLVVRRCYDLPPFQTAFSGYGKNKMTWILQLRREGYSLFQMSSFLIHYPHKLSKSRVVWNGGNGGRHLARPKGDKGSDFWLQYKRGRNDLAFVEFRNYLSRQIPDRTKIVPCQDAMDVDDDAKLWVDHGYLHEENQSGVSSGGEGKHGDTKSKGNGKNKKEE